MQNLSKTVRTIGNSLNRNSPVIFTAFAIGGLITTVVMAVRATPRAIEILEYEERYRISEEKDVDYRKDITLLDKIELTWKVYAPSAAMGTMTIAAIIFANQISMRRNAALLSLFRITETTLRDYQAKVVETLGAAKEEKIRGALAEEKLEKNPVNTDAMIFTGNGNYLCYDAFSGRYFKSDVEAIRKSENAFNAKLIREGWLDINEFYDELGLEPIDSGKEMGWIADHAILEIKYTTKMAKNGEPCLVLDYRVAPKHI